MSYICLPHDFDAQTGECKSFQIALSDGGDLTPVGYLRGCEGLPVDLGRLSENFAAVLNGNNPLYRLGPDHQMFYEPYPGGMNLRFRKKDGGGISEVGVMFTLSPGAEMDFVHEA